jgi:hypothetical protein
VEAALREEPSGVVYGTSKPRGHYQNIGAIGRMLSEKGCDVYNGDVAVLRKAAIDSW